MHHAAIFVGYRGREDVVLRRPRLPLPPVGLLLTPRLSPPEIWNLGKLPYQLKVYAGYAPDDYPADYVQLPFMSLITSLIVWDNPVMVRFDYKGVQFGEREVGNGFMKPECATGFMIRNVVAGNAARYQFVFWR